MDFSYQERQQSEVYDKVKIKKMMWQIIGWYHKLDGIKFPSRFAVGLNIYLFLKKGLDMLRSRQRHAERADWVFASEHDFATSLCMHLTYNDIWTCEIW